MVNGIRYRKFVQYALIVSTLLIQIIILIFFYNEFFNEGKLKEIEIQLKRTKKVKTLTDESKKELFVAYSYLQTYINKPDKESLELYFNTLKTVVGKMDSAKIYVSSMSENEGLDSTKNMHDELENLGKLIDSIYTFSPQFTPQKQSLKINEINLDYVIPTIEKEESLIEDSVPVKKFFPRLKDAIKGNVEVKTDTVYITTTYSSDFDTSKIKNDIDSTLSVVSEHYINEVKNYKKKIKYDRTNNRKVYGIYDNLITLSNDLIDVYDMSTNDLGEKFERQYNERFSRINTIRKYAVFGLMLLLFIVLIIMAYFTKLSFVYERELKEANKKTDQNLQFKNRILGMLSHEIRAPLKIIHIFINRIYKKTTDESIKESLKSMRFTNESLLIQAGQILDYTRNQEKEIVLNPVSFHLKEELDAILTIFKPYIESVNNQLEYTNSIPSDLVVMTDKSKIHQIFINLLGNANKFTENGTITVHLAIQEIDNKHIRLKTEISDTGVGISKDDIKKIFEPYYKGMIAEEVTNLGAGLGLNLCKELIALFQGEIKVKSTLGKGTTIEFEINLNYFK